MGVEPAAADRGLLSRLESAGLNASAPPHQLWLDGWLLRCWPGKARRARCINALGPGHLPLAQKFALAEQVYRDAGVPMIFRITRFTSPDTPEATLHQRGFEPVDPTDIMACPQLPSTTADAPLPDDCAWEALAADAFAEAVGTLRGTPPEQRSSHALRLRASPVPYRGFAIRRTSDGAVLACGQFAREGELVGLYDVFTAPQARGRGLASLLCERLLALSASEGARLPYLQVEHANTVAQRVYRRLGFTVVDRYHYLQRPEPPSSPA